jgi:hypothetical protein
MKRRSDHRGRGEQLLGVVRQPVETATDGVADSFRDRHGRPGVELPGAADDHSLRHEMLDDLLDKERVALGLRCDHVQGLLRGRSPGDGGDE